MTFLSLSSNKRVIEQLILKLDYCVNGILGMHDNVLFFIFKRDQSYNVNMTHLLMKNEYKSLAYMQETDDYNSIESYLLVFSTLAKLMSEFGLLRWSFNLR